MPCTWVFQIRTTAPNLQIHGLIFLGEHCEDHALELYEARAPLVTRAAMQKYGKIEQDMPLSHPLCPKIF
jgi:hypothetical protein